MALLQSFNESKGPQAKRRKLVHQGASAEESDGESAGSAGAGEQREDIDEVDEPENLDADDAEDEPDSEDEENLTDPFDTHFAHPDDQVVAKGVNAVKRDEWNTSRALLSPLRATTMAAGSENRLAIPSPTGIDSLKLKKKLQETANTMEKQDTSLRAVLPLLFGYQDILHCDRTVKNSKGLRQAVCLHALNHVFKYVLMRPPHVVRFWRSALT